jgi:HAD superfamily phosphoserine phosphatase-like hydrolase/HAD superfamily hydrolase (TIGR01549 family)
MIGEVGSLGVYEAVAPLMRMTPEHMTDFVDRHAALDPDFPAFLEWARSVGVDVKIVSDGFDRTIETLFAKHGIEGLDVYANRLEILPDKSVRMTSPYANPECGWCGTCKLGIVRRFRSSYDRIILIGDGESDRHAAAHADFVLALKDLFVYCAREGIPAMRIDRFHVVPRLLTRQIHAVAFDMDGTLVDSVVSIADSFNHMFATLGYPTMTVDEVVRKTNISLRDFLERFLKPEEFDEGLKIFRDYYDEIFLERTEMMPAAMDALDSLDGSIRTGVVTNKRGRYARRIAEYFGFADKMTRIIGAEDGFKAKPSGAMLLEFMRSVGSDRDGTIYVGDSPIDVEAAADAGIDAFALVSPTFSAEELALCGACRVMKSIAELPSALEPILQTDGPNIGRATG